MTKMLPWFKFFGSEYLSDPKIRSLSLADRSCWVTLLCYASQTEGVIKHLSENALLLQAGLDPVKPEWSDALGVLKRLEELEMIRVDNAVITLVNWKKRQETYLTGYERVKKYREKQKDLENDNDDDNAMITLEREDKRDKRDKNKRVRFVKPTITEVREYCKERRNDIDPEAFLDFYEAKGWKVGNQPMKDWKAAVRTWERRRSEGKTVKSDKFKGL